MTYREERYVLDSIREIRREIHENNLMLSAICNVVNVYLANHHRENEDDFGRNILANIVSQSIGFEKLK